MIPIKNDPDCRARWQIVEQHFCTRPSFDNGTPLQISDLDGLMELSFVFFAGWLFCGILNRDKELVRPCLLPMGKDGSTSLLVLYHPSTPLAAPARRDEQPNFNSRRTTRSAGCAFVLCPELAKRGARRLQSLGHHFTGRCYD
jgi:hypothetical protein